MSATVASQSSSSQSTKRMSRELDRRSSRSSPRNTTTAAPIGYGPIGGTTKPTTNGYRRSPGSPRSQNEDERAASVLQGLTAGQYGKIGSPRDTHSSRPKPSTHETSPSTIPKIKTEHPPSPDPASRAQHQSSRDRQHRPRRLDLSNDMPSSRTSGGNNSDRPLNSREAVALSAMQDVGLLCLSPGFQTQDPAKQQQLAKSMEMREQQRQLIESRLHEQATNGNTNKALEVDKSRSSGDSPSNNNSFPKPPPASSKRKGPPPGLSINAPAPHQFASEPRVIQSAPINQSFTGLKPAPAHEHPLSRQVLQHTHHHNQFHAPSQPNGNPQFAPLGSHPPNSGQRLPPISDVMASQDLAAAASSSSAHAQYAPLAAPIAPPYANGSRPSPAGRTISSSSRRRTREEYEADMQPPPLGDAMDVDGGSRGRVSEHARQRARLEEREHRERGAAALFEEGVRTGVRDGEEFSRLGLGGATRDANWEERNRRKRDEFLAICGRAWDLLHAE